MTFFSPKTISGQIRVRPLLTPDPGSYQPKVLALIKSATKTFYMQTQYIHTSDAAEDAAHMELIQAIADQIDAGVDVRLITSEFQTKDWIEKLKDAGVKTTDHLRIQANVHNKGITVDSKIVMVSSQNWSAEGTLRNRDAGLIIYHEDAAAYFEQIFLHDWAYLASAKSGRLNCKNPTNSFRPSFPSLNVLSLCASAGFARATDFNFYRQPHRRSSGRFETEREIHSDRPPPPFHPERGQVTVCPGPFRVRFEPVIVSRIRVAVMHPQRYRFAKFPVGHESRTALE